MTTYSDDYSLRDKDVIKVNDIANAIDGLLADYYVSSASAVISTTSTSYTAMGSMSVTATVSAGQLALILAQANVSNGTADKATYLKLYEDSTAISQNMLHVSYAGQVNGTLGTISASIVTAPTAGSHTYSAQWATSSGGTAYSAGRGINVVLLRHDKA